MSAGLKRAGTTALFAAAMLCAACDNSQNQADKKVRADLVEARYLAKTDSLENAKAKLTEAAGNTDASPAAKAQAMAARAQSELETAVDLVQQIDQKDLELSRVEWGIIELAQQIRSSNSARAGYQKFDPKPIKDAIEAKLSEVRGGADKPAWFPHASSSVPTLATVTQEIARLDGELAQKNTELNTLTARRTSLIDQADQAGAQANSLKGQESVTAFATASNHRKQAGDVGVQIDGLKNQIGRLERQLAVAKGQQTVVNEVIVQLQDQIQQADQAWKNYETQAAAHQQLSAQILGTPVSGDQAGAVGGTISQKAAEVDRLAKEIQELRSSAVAAANNASEFFANAYTSASTAEMDLKKRIQEHPERPERSTWQGMADALNPLRYRLRQAAAQRVLGELYASEAASAGSRIEARDTVQTALAGTGLSVPGTLANAELPALRQTALGNAETAYTSSEELLSGLVEGGGPAELKGMAHVNRALSFYGWAQVARQAKNETKAKERIVGAMSARDLAFENNAPLPAMPLELGPPPKRAEPSTAEAAPANPADPVADEAAARATIEKFFAALEAGDSAAAKNVSEIEPGAEPMFDVVVALFSNLMKMDKAAQQKFGAQPATQPGQMTFSATNPREEMSKARITITGDEAVLAGDGPPKPGDQNKLVRKNGEWKLLFAVPNTDEEKQGIEMLGKMNTAIAEITAGIGSGKYNTMEDVGGAFMQAMFSSMGPGGPGGGPPITITPGPDAPPPQ